MPTSWAGYTAVGFAAAAAAESDAEAAAAATRAAAAATSSAHAAAAAEDGGDAAEQQQRDVRWYRADPAALDLLQPDAAADQAHDARWEIHPDGQWILGNHPDTSTKQRTALIDLLQQQKPAFAYSMAEMPGYVSSTHGSVEFELKDASPEAAKRMWSAPRWFTPDQLDIGDAKVKELIDNNIAYEVPTTHPFVSEVTMPRKRAPDGSWTDHRFCVDLRAVNANTVVDKFTMPLPEDLFRRMRGAKFVSKLDLRSGFMQLSLASATQAHLGFRWRSRVYCFQRLPFGHVNATAVFQRCMEDEIRACGLEQQVCCFVDDLCVYTDSFEEHMQVLQRLLAHFHKVGLRVHPAKSIFCADCVPYLGHLLSAKELKADPAKVSAMHALKPPTTVNRLQAHLGLFNYYRCYIPNFSIIAKPLYDLLVKGALWVWGIGQQQSYDSLRSYLTEHGGALQQPREDCTFHLYTDWSVHGVAAVLNQRDESGAEFMVACASRTCNPAERNYTAWKGEMMAAVWAVKLFKPYLLTRHFFLHTDARSLLWLLTAKEPVGIQYRYVLALQEYRFSLVHKQGKLNAVADACSREPNACAADVTGARFDQAFEQHPLPAVHNADLSLDPTPYSHDSLARDLGIEAKPVKGKASGQQRQHQHQPAAAAPAAAQVAVTATAGAMGLSPAVTATSLPSAAAALAAHAAVRGVAGAAGINPAVVAQLPAAASATSAFSLRYSPVHRLSAMAASLAGLASSSAAAAASAHQQSSEAADGLVSCLAQLADQPSQEQFPHAVLQTLMASNDLGSPVSQFGCPDTWLGGG